MLDQLRSLAVFAKVVEAGSFRAAARALALSPSVVSHHVAELEERLSVPLLYRSTRRLSLTPDGETLIVEARKMVDAAERGLDAVSGGSATPAGALRATAPAFLADTPLSRDIAAFSAAHPKVRLTLSFTDEPRDLLRDGLDLALRIGTLQDSTHITRKLGDMRRVLVGAPRYVSGRAAPRSPADLASWDHVLLSSRPAVMELSSGRQKTLAVPFTPRISVDSAAAIRELVIAGAGIAMLPEVTVRPELARGRLVELLPGWRLATMGVFAIWPHSAQRAGLTVRFVDFLAPRVATLFAPAGK